MSLLGPDDFELSRKERMKKLAKDLSPAVQKEVERLLDMIDEPGAFERLVELVGMKRARLMVTERRLHRKSKRDKLLDE